MSRAALPVALAGLAGLFVALAPRDGLAQAFPPPAPPTTAPPPVGAPPAAPPPSGYDPSMQAGGLAPPPPMTPTTPATPPPPGVEENLDKAKQEDSGRGLSWVWLEVEGGFEHVGLSTFEVDEQNLTAGFVDSTASGGLIGAGLGVRLVFLTLGARARAGFFSAWQLFSIGGELGFHIPLGNLEPHFELGGGYTGLGSLSGAVSGANDAISIHGFDARISGGLDYYVTPVFSIGGKASWEILGLTRPGVSPKQVAEIQAQNNVEAARAEALAAEGSGYGSAFALNLVAGLHF